MIPGEFHIAEGEITLNALSEGQEVVLEVSNTGDRPIQVGSHDHVYAVHPARTVARESSRGLRLDIPAGTAVRFEPGQKREVRLVPYAGSRRVFGFRGQIMGPLDANAPREEKA